MPPESPISGLKGGLSGIAKGSIPGSYQPRALEYFHDSSARKITPALRSQVDVTRCKCTTAEMLSGERAVKMDNELITGAVQVGMY